MLGYFVSPTANVIRRQNIVSVSLSKDWRSPESNSRPVSLQA